MDTEPSAVFSARECDALKDEDVTPLPTSQPHVVFRLRREEDEYVPWIVELVFLLFNAQGDVLQVVRGAKSPDTSVDRTSATTSYFGEANLRATRAKLKEADEREVIRFSLAKLHPFVEVVGCLVTYLEDEIARAPQLNAFSLTCDLHDVDSSQVEAEAQALAAGGKRFVFNHSGERTRLLSVSHDPKRMRRSRGKHSNVVLLCKIFRRHGDHHDWAFHAAAADRSNVVVRSAVTASLVEAMQVFLLDLMPEIKIPNRSSLSSVSGICAALSCSEFLGIEKYFPDGGLGKVDFARLLLWELIRTRLGLLQHLARATMLVGLLFEMFEQIDINGDAVVDWEEFTSFCVAIGLVPTRAPHDDNDHDESQTHGDEHAAPRNLIVYRQEPLGAGAATRTFPYQVSKLKTFQQLKRLAVIEHKSPRILIFDLDMNFLHELNCSEKLAAEKKAGEKQQDVLDSLEVLDAEHVPSRNALAIASSDLCISLWSVIDATVGSYVFNGKLAGRFPALFVKWCPAPLKRLFVAGGSTDQVQLWDLEVPMHAGAAPPPPPMLLPRSHTERVAVCLDLSDTPYVATASFDHTITIWETVAGVNSALGGPSAVLTVSFVLRGHQQAVLTLDSANNLLLSSGFEYQAYCWGISGRVLKTKLGGHHHCLMGAKFVSTSVSGPCLAVTGDQSGHFKLWDITRCAKGLSGSHLALMLQTFELHTPNLCGFRMFMTSSKGTGTVGSDKQHETQGSNSTPEIPACDIITGNLRLYRFSAFTQTTGQEDSAVDDSPGLAPTRFVTFNAVANTFVGVVENRITVWSANSGAKIEEPVVIRDAEVCAIAFDSPRERKLYVATNDGAIRLYNPVTGALLQKTVVHDGTVTSLVFCSHANCLVSTGDDRMICVLDSPPGKSKLEVMHYVEKAHNSSITCCTCSPPPQFADTQTTRFVATGDDTGGVQVYDLRRITFLFRCASVHTREIRALHFPTALSGLLISGDATGAIFVWQTIGVRSSTVQPLMRLMMQELTPAKPLQSKVDFDGIISMCSTNIHQEERLSTHPELLYVGLETGQIFAWDLRSFSGKIQLEPTRRSAILRRRSSDSKGGDIPTFEGGIAVRRASGMSGSSAFPVMMSTKSWMAHQTGILSIQSVYYPGELLSLGADGIVKIWDNAAACVGHILTIGDQTAASASAWKYVRRDHTGGGEQKDLFERIAREVIAKHQRRLKKEQNQQRKSPQSDFPPSDNSLATPSSLLELDLPVSPPLGSQSSGDSLFPDASTAVTNAATALIMQVPFSVTSVTSGIQHGFFGPEEAHHLRSIAKNSKALVADASDKRKRVAALAPLFSSPEEMGRARAKAKAKARALMNNPMTPDLHGAGARILTNYPLEIERRTAAAAKISVGASRALDVEPSQFLREKLPNAASPMAKAVKSTPKKRLQPAIDIKMDASVVILARNVSLPKLTQPQESEEFLRSSQDLSSCASAPALASTAPLESPSSPEKLRCNSNVERKLKLCQKIVANVCLMSSKPKISKEEVKKEKLDSPTSKMRRKKSTLSISPGKNPFGPHYTVKQVEQLAVGLARLDEDGSGDLNQHEWTQLVTFCGLEGSSTRNTATSVENLFHSIDRDSSGTISLRELLPTLFRQASPEQLQQMRALIQTRMKRLHSTRNGSISPISTNGEVHSQ